MENATITYRDVNQLKREFKITNIFSYPDDFNLEMAILTKDEVINYNNKLKSLSSACGCNTSKIFMGIFILVYAVSLLLDINIFPMYNHYLKFTLFVIIGALIGKGFSLTINNFKLNKTINEIEQKIKARRPQKQRKQREILYAMG